MLEHRQGSIALYLIAFSQQIRKKKRQSTCGTLSPLVPTKVLGWLEIKFHWHIISTFFLKNGLHTFSSFSVSRE